MQTYRVDLHVHTRASPDALDHPEVIVEAARRRGLHGIAITDHDRRAGYDRLVRLGLADPTGAPVDGFLVIPGVEVSCVEGHVLVIGAAWDTGRGVPAEMVVRRARAEGALAIAAHPFDRLRSGVGPRTLREVRFDALETCNSKSIEKHSNAVAAAYALAHGIPAVGGSDAHFADAVGRAHTVVRAREFSVAGVVAAIREGSVAVASGRHSMGEVVRYWARGWLTRPWALDLCSRAAGRLLRRSGIPDFAAALERELDPPDEGIAPAQA